MTLTMSRQQKHTLASYALVALILAIVVLEPAMAGTATGGSNIFGSLVAMLISWLKGGLGLLLAIIALVAGLVAGVARGSLGGALGGIGVAIAAYWGPDILQGIFGATSVVPTIVTLASF